MKSNLKLAVAAILSISALAGPVQAGHQTPQQIRDAQQVAHMKNILAQLQAEQRRQAALQGNRSYVQPLASSTHAGTLGGNFGGVGATYIGGNFSSGGLTKPTYIYPIQQRWGQLSAREQARGAALDSYMSTSQQNSLRVNQFGTHVYRSR